MQNRSSKKNAANQWAKSLVDLVTGNPITEDISPIKERGKNPAAVLPGKLSSEQRSETARKSANRRWHKS